MEKVSVDIAIIGAGPAGCTAALAIGEGDLRVALIDQSSFPRDKVCGDGIMAYVPKVLNTIDPKYREAFLAFEDKNEIDGLRIIGDAGKYVDVIYPDKAYNSKRIHFDNFLFEQASQLENVEVMTNTKVQDIIQNENGFEIKTDQQTIHARLVIGCDGANGVSRKKLSPVAKDADHHAGAVKAYFKNVKEVPDKLLEIYFLKDSLPGYFWIFPLANGEYNVGFGMKTSAISEQRINLKAEMMRLINEHPLFKDRFKEAEQLTKIEGYGLPLGSRKVPLSGDGFLFCGDAGHLIEPLTGEGIGQAMVSGRYAGWHAKKCFEQNNFSAIFMKTYDQMVYDKLWKDHHQREFLAKLIEKRPWLMDFGIRLITKFPVVKKWLMKIFW